MMDVESVNKLMNRRAEEQAEWKVWGTYVKTRPIGMMIFYGVEVKLERFRELIT